MRCTQAHLFVPADWSSTGKPQIWQKMTLVILRIMLYAEKYPQNKGNSEGCKTFMVLWTHSVRQISSAESCTNHGKPLLSQLVALAHFKANSTVPRHWSCGCVAKHTEQPPFSNVISYKEAQQKCNFPLHKQNHMCPMTQSRDTISMSPTAVRASRACKLAAVTQAKIF